MKPENEQVLFVATRLGNFGQEEKVTIIMWRDYGIVAPGVWTTNGSAGYVAQCLHMGNWIIPEEYRCETQSELASKLKIAYDSWRKKT